ncbi:hypothetical protein JCM8097_007294 [Rhodosporidiobolus ruineniae]
MAKAKPAAAQPPPKRSAATEIDDIFAAPAKKPKQAPPADEPAQAPATGASKKKKGKKAGAAAGGTGEAAHGSAAPSSAGAAAAGGDKLTPAPAKRAPVEVVDTSKAIEAYRPEDAPAMKALAANATEAEKKAFEEEERFMDSRGTRRKTDDGLPIFSESELKIGLGGDTELCPFDCQCCF